MINMSHKQTKKTKRWPWILGALVLVAFAAAALLPSVMPDRILSNAGSAAVTKGGIAVTVVGTGKLEGADETDATEVPVPVGVKINKVNAESGDTVAKGDILATVDPLSLRQRITAVQGEITSLDAKISRSKDDTDDTYIKAGVSGRVKRIYARKGDLISDIMRENGMIMLISLDGKMAVDFETAEPLPLGGKVTIVLEDGSKKQGTVVRAKDGVYTVALSDDGPKTDERVDVLDRDGNALGSGALYVHQPIAITGSFGTVGEIHVYENQQIYERSRLVTLENVPPPAEYLQLLADRDELADALNLLLALSERNAVVALADGVVSSVAVSKDTSVSASAAGAQTAVAFTIARDDIVTLAVEIDELDILSIQTGQEAIIVFNALPEQQYTGTISKIASSSHSQSGIAKYTVQITLANDPSMKIGMNATATIHIQNKDGILMLPVEALQELGDRIFVYTVNDEKTGVLSGEKEVRTGISDGIRVEIISGLSEGETVFYPSKASESGNPFTLGPRGGMPGRRLPQDGGRQ